MNDNNGIYFIDEKTREKMRVFDMDGKNIFTSYLTLIMDFSPYISRIVFGKTLKNTDYRIIYVKQGSAVIMFNLVEYELKQGSLVYLNKNSTITTKWVSPDYNPLTVGFDTETIAQKYTDLAFCDSVFIQTSDKDSESIASSFYLLYTFAEKSIRMDAGMEGVLMAMLNIVNNLKNDEIEKFSSTTNTGNRIVKLFMFYLNIEKYPERSVQSYAEKIKVSPDHLSKIVKKETGYSPSYWIDRRTVQITQVMLCENPKISLDDIAKILHCGSDAQLIKIYKRVTGETPGEYRKKYIPIG